VSCSAKPITTAPTAVVATTLSGRKSIAATANSAMTIVSWTMFGKRSGIRSRRHGLMTRTTAALASAKASSSGLVVWI